MNAVDTELLIRAEAAPRLGEPSQFARRIGFPLALLVVDLLAISVAFYAAWYARYVLQIGGDVEPEDFVEFAIYFPLQLVLYALVPLQFQLAGLYRFPTGSWVDIIGAVVRGTALGVMMLLAGTAMLRYPASSRLTFVYVWALSSLTVVGGRIALNIVGGWLHRRGVALERVLVVGDSSRGRMIMQSLAGQRHRGYQVVGYVNQTGGGSFGRFRSLGTFDDLSAVVEQHGVTQIIVALPPEMHPVVLQTLDRCRQDGVTFKVVPDLFEMRLSQVDTATVWGIPLIGLREVTIQGWNLLVKRSLDIALSALLLIVLLPLLAVLALLIKLDSPRGSTIYRQPRLGKGGGPFTMYKFRSMRPGAEGERGALEALNEAQGPLFKMRADPRLTRVGRVIRRYSLDELPQLVNVLRGEMSLVGPRPPIAEEVERYEEWHKKRLEVSPGMTGLWQVSGRSELAFDEMIMYDLYYIENWSLSLDLRILLRTLPTMLSGGGAF